jgi:aspartyl-tRNA(Asn)/glutamyl-tRNA(Gln) amidotransferase subunit A
MSVLADLGVVELVELYRSGQASPVEALESCLARIDRLDPQVNAVLTLLTDRARAQAEESARRWATGTPRILEGVPFGLKDIVATAGIRSTGGSPIFANHYPQVDATVARRLQEAGGVLVAKLQTSEFASGSNASTSNPWDLETWCGGSSSGPGAVVAARELPLSIGTDTGGSIAIPAAFCGVAGLKPTFGRVPRTGVMPLSWTLDHIGPMANSAADIALALQAIAGHDPLDPTSATAPVPDYGAELDRGLQGVRVGIPEHWFFGVCDPEVEAAIQGAAAVMADLGAVVTTVGMPVLDEIDLHAIELTIVYAEAASLHEVNLPRILDCGPEFQKLLARSQFTSATDYLKALRARHLVQLEFQRVFEDVDVILAPAGVCVAPRHDHLVAKIGEEERSLIDVISRPTAVMDIVGVPALSIPVGLSRQGLPMGMQIAAQPHRDGLCLRVAHAYQQVTEHHRVLPDIVRVDGASSRDPEVVAPRPGLVEKELATAILDKVW